MCIGLRNNACKQNGPARTFGGWWKTRMMLDLPDELNVDQYIFLFFVFLAPQIGKGGLAEEKSLKCIYCSRLHLKTTTVHELYINKRINMRFVLQANLYVSFACDCRLSVSSLIRMCCVPTDSWPLMTWCRSCRRTRSSWTMTVSGKWSRWSSNFWKTKMEKFRTWQWNGTGRIVWRCIF